MTKRCTKCREFKPYDRFYLSRNKPDGYQNYCKDCCSDRQTWYRRLNLYGLTKEQFEAMLAAQSGNCAVCFMSFGDDPPNLDHRHDCCPSKKTCGKCARGLLCSRCNLALGSFSDDCSLFGSAMEYLLKHGGCK